MKTFIVGYMFIVVYLTIISIRFDLRTFYKLTLNMLVYNIITSILFPAVMLVKYFGDKRFDRKSRVLYRNPDVHNDKWHNHGDII